MSLFNKKIEQESIHIRILRYADTHEQFTPEDIRRELDLSAKQMLFLQDQLGSSPFFMSLSGPTYHYALTFEGKSRLLEYDELSFVRQDSREAKRLAVVAIIISLVAIVLQCLQFSRHQDVNIINEIIRTEVTNLSGE